MAIDANGGVSANAGFDASLTNEQQVSQFGNDASQWGNSVMSTVLNNTFGSAPGSSQDALSTGPNGGSSTSNELAQIMFQLGEIFEELEQLMGQQNQGSGGSSPTGGSGGGSSPNPEPIYQNASGSSWGDPHQSFNGTSENGGAAQTGTSNNMGSQSDLIDSNQSFTGGYQVSTTATTPDSNGIAYNGSATISTGNGWSQVSMGANGQASVWDDGQYLNLQKGQTLTLSSGATVSEAQNGDVTVDDKNGDGGDMSTTLHYNGKGVDVNFNAQNVALGGYDASLGAPSSSLPTLQPQQLLG